MQNMWVYSAKRSKILIIFILLSSYLYGGTYESQHFVVQTNLSNGHAKRIADWAELHYGRQCLDYGVSTKLKSHKPIIEYTYGGGYNAYTDISNHLSKPSKIVIQTRTIDDLLDLSLPHEMNHLIVLEHHIMRGHKGAILLEGLAGLYESKHRQRMSDSRMRSYKNNGTLFSAHEFIEIENTRVLTGYRNQMFYDQSRSFTKYVRSKLTKEKFRLLMYSLLLDVDPRMAFRGVGLNYYTTFNGWKNAI